MGMDIDELESRFKQALDGNLTFKPAPPGDIRAILWAELGDGDKRPRPGCGRAKFLDDFHLDHVEPKSKGGGDNFPNRQLLCGSCNVRKSND